MTVLVTGGVGFIGTNFVLDLYKFTYAGNLFAGKRAARRSSAAVPDEDH